MQNREKQIEEITNSLYESDNKGNILICGIEELAEELYNADYRKQEWISVDERLPEIEGVYLAYTTRRTIEIAHFYPYYVNGKPQFDYWITHWMPLPEAPKVKGEKNG